MSQAKKPSELFSYNLTVDSISSEEEIGFDAFLNRGNDKSEKNNKRKPSFSKKEEKNTKKLKKHDSMSEEDDSPVIITKVKNKNTNNNDTNNNNNKKMKEANPYEYLLKNLEKDKGIKTNQISDPSIQDALNRSRKLKATIQQTQQSLSSQSNTLDLVEDDDSDVVKITINFVEKNRQFIFAVKKLEKFDLLAEKIGNILNVPANHVQLKLYAEVIDLKKCPNDYAIMNNEKLTMAVNAPSTKTTTKPQTSIQKVILEDELDGQDNGEVDEYEKELERLISEASNSTKKSDNGPKKITLHVCIPGQTKHQKFKILPTDKFGKIIDAIFAEWGKRIKLQFEGEIIDPESVPNDYDMEGGEQIDGKW